MIYGAGFAFTIGDSLKIGDAMFRSNMKFLISLAIFISPVAGPILAYSQWEFRYPQIPAETITDLAFINDRTGFFSNSAGSIYKTSDGGYTWKLHVHFPRDQIKQIIFVDTDLGFAVSPRAFSGDQISLLKTINGGLTWEITPHNLNDAIVFLPLGETVGIKSHFGGISKSADAFSTWQVKYKMPFFVDVDVGVPFGEITTFQKLPGGSIVALGNNYLARSRGVISDSVSFVLVSEDSGETWQSLWKGTPRVLGAMHFATDKIGWLGGEWNTMLKTKDGGITWNVQYQDSLSPEVITSIFAVDSLTVYAISNYGTAFFSNDGGISWQTQNVHEYFESRNKIVFLSPTHGFIIGGQGRILINETSGNNWRPVYDTFDTQIHAIEFVNSQIGWAGGTKFDYSLKTAMFKTIDGGYTWTQQQVDEAYMIIDIDMLNERDGWAVGGNRVYRTRNGGETWTSFKFIENSHIRGVYFLDDNFGVVYEVWDENTGQFYNYITNDGGRTWNPYILPKTSSFSKLKFTDRSHGWMLNSEALWFSADTGKTWSKNSNLNIQNGFSFDFIDSTTGWVAANFREIYRTHDGGKSWQAASLPSANQTLDLMFVDKERGFICGTNGAIFVTIDGGENWFRESSFTSNLLLALDSYSDGKTIDVWTAGDGMAILHKSLLVTRVTTRTDPVGRDFNLAQNYPNPFNSGTFIRFEIPSGLANASAHLAIYNLRGELVRELLNRRLAAGNHFALWDGRNDAGLEVASGIYFYRLHVGNVTEMRKLSLLR